jgi:hypothetical protein
MLCLAAGIIKEIRSDPFPSGDQRPHATVIMLCDNALIRVVAYDEIMTAMETLQPGDAVSIQGALMIETRQGKLAGLFVVAGQVLPLRRRSANRAMAAAMA